MSGCTFYSRAYPIKNDAASDNSPRPSLSLTDAQALAARTRVTHLYERWRAFASGIIETAGTTFLLLIAVKSFQADATSKALIASGGSLGLLLSPLLVWMAGVYQWKTARAGCLLMLWGSLLFFATALLPALPLLIFASTFGLAASTLIIPLVTQIYEDNYPKTVRGQLFSRTVVIRIAIAAIFSEVAGRYLVSNLGWQRVLLLCFGAAFAFAAYCFSRYPSAQSRLEYSSHPFRSFRYVKEDRLFRHTLICWMLMGFANLMMIPMRVEFLANEKHGIALGAGEIAFLTGVVPNMVRLLLSPAWGWLFDRVNFFTLRLCLNCGFALGIFSFFLSSDLTGLVFGAVVFGISTAGGDVAWSLWVTKFAPSSRVADYMAVHTFLTGLRGLVAPLAAFQALNYLTVSQLGVISIVLIGLANIMLIPEIKFFPQRATIDAVVEEALDEK